MGMGNWAICKRCGEEMLPWMYSRENDVCTTCYVVDSRGRFADEEHDRKVLEKSRQEREKRGLLGVDGV